MSVLELLTKAWEFIKKIKSPEVAFSPCERHQRSYLGVLLEGVPRTDAGALDSASGRIVASCTGRALVLL